MATALVLRRTKAERLERSILHLTWLFARVAPTAHGYSIPDAGRSTTFSSQRGQRMLRMGRCRSNVFSPTKEDSPAGRLASAPASARRQPLVELAPSAQRGSCGHEERPFTAPFASFVRQAPTCCRFDSVKSATVVRRTRFGAREIATSALACALLLLTA